MDRTVYGYVRVSSKDQNLDRQLIDMIHADVPRKNIYIDRQSGKDFARPSYQRLTRKKLQRGDVIIVKSIDRLGRNYNEILNEWKFITKEKKANIKIIDMPLLNTENNNDLIGTLISDIVLQLLSFVAENERINIKQRQAEGIAAARARGVKFGRPHKAMPANFPEVYALWNSKKIKPQNAMIMTGLSRQEFYNMATRYKKQYQENQQDKAPSQNSNSKNSQI